MILPLLHEDKENMSYDVESLSTNILIEETINFITEKVYIHKKLTQICLKLIYVY